MASCRPQNEGLADLPSTEQNLRREVGSQPYKWVKPKTTVVVQRSYIAQSEAQIDFDRLISLLELYQIFTRKSMFPCNRRTRQEGQGAFGSDPARLLSDKICSSVPEPTFASPLRSEHTLLAAKIQPSRWQGPPTPQNTVMMVLCLMWDQKLRLRRHRYQSQMSRD